MQRYPRYACYINDNNTCPGDNQIYQHDNKNNNTKTNNCGQNHEEAKHQIDGEDNTEHSLHYIQNGNYNHRHSNNNDSRKRKCAKNGK